MDPELLRELLQLIEQARAEGASDREITSQIRRNRDIPFKSLRALESAARDQGVTLGGQNASGRLGNDPP